MIKEIYKILRVNEKKYFYFIFLLLCLNSFFELLTLVVFYPLLQILFENSYNYNYFNIIFEKLYLRDITLNKIIYFSLGLILIIFFIKNFFYIYFVYHQNKFIKIIRKRIVNQLISKYIFSAYSSFFKKNLGNIVRNADLAKNFPTIATSLIIFYSEILVSFMLIGFLLNIEFKLTFSLIILLFLLIIIIKTFSKNKFYRLGVVSQKYSELLNKIILQTFYNIREIKILRKESFFASKVIKINDLEAENNFSRDVLLQLPKSIIEFVVIFIIIIVVISMIVIGYTKSEILVYSSLMAITSVRLMPSATRIATALQRLKYSQSMNQTLIKELELKVENEKYSNKNLNKKLITFKKNIIFSNVNFSYDNQKTVIKDLNFNIKKNYCIGIIGPSGSGKSTFIDLLIGLLKPTSGFIKFDDVTLNQKIHYWADKISYVSQSPLFLNDTIENNIAFGINEKDINKKLIVEVSKKAQIFNDIKKLKLNFKTKISEISKNFSGGQLQRIAIARALYRNPELIIFDEATNALDKFTEEAILKTLKSLKKKITMIIISHNKNNLKICDKVYELKNKRLVNKY